jgi:hypothetical protein
MRCFGQPGLYLSRQRKKDVTVDNRCNGSGNRRGCGVPDCSRGFDHSRRQAVARGRCGKRDDQRSSGGVASPAAGVQGSRVQGGCSGVRLQRQGRSRGTSVGVDRGSHRRRSHGGRCVEGGALFLNRGEGIAGGAEVWPQGASRRSETKLGGIGECTTPKTEMSL